MCTVTFVPAKDGVFLVSNRDEKHFRSDALPPNSYKFPSGEIFFPKDADAGGTWIAMHVNGNAIVFLNGGLEAHTPDPPYRKSRGMILLDLLDTERPSEEFNVINLVTIEPFTAVIWDRSRLYECIWDGKEKHFTEKDNSHPHIWSSVTLYEENARSRRRHWFDQWLGLNPEPGLDNILDFHQFSGDGDLHNSLLMNREDYVFTVSITGMKLTPVKGEMVYLDVKNSRKSFFEFRFNPTTAVAQR